MGTRIISCIAISIASFLTVWQAAHAQTISDFDMPRFEALASKYKVQAHTDPFERGTISAEDLAIEDLQLTGIVYASEVDAYALISGYLVRPGDIIAGYRVDRIEKDRVNLKRIDEVFILSLGGGI